MIIRRDSLDTSWNCGEQVMWVCERVAGDDHGKVASVGLSWMRGSGNMNVPEYNIKEKGSRQRKLHFLFPQLCIRAASVVEGSSWRLGAFIPTCCWCPQFTSFTRCFSFIFKSYFIQKTVSSLQSWEISKHFSEYLSWWWWCGSLTETRGFDLCVANNKLLSMLVASLRKSGLKCWN